MNFAKKTMSFALASVMVASSLLTGTSALAAEKKVITPMTGTSQAIVATVKDNQVNGNSYYSFTPATTGYYAVTLASKPIYKSTDGTYSANYTTGAERVDQANVSISKSYNATTNEFSENVAYVSAPQSYSIDWTQASASSAPVETKGYYDALETVQLTGGHTYYISAYTSSESNLVSGSENHIIGSATLKITPSDFYVDIQEKTVSKKSFNNSEDKNITTPVAYVSYVGAAKDVVVPNFVNNTIPVEKFEGSNNEKITSLTLSPNVKSVDGLSDIKTLASVNLANVEKIESGAFSGCSALNNVVIPASVKTIGESAFSGCSALSSVTFNEGVKKIGRYAFYNTALNAAVLPAFPAQDGLPAVLHTAPPGRNPQPALSVQRIHPKPYLTRQSIFAPASPAFSGRLPLQQYPCGTPLRLHPPHTQIFAEEVPFQNAVLPVLPSAL